MDKEIINLTQSLIDKGTKFDLDFLNNTYADDLKFISIDKNNNIQTLTKEDNINFFKNLKESNAEPLNNYAEFHYADNDGKNGFVILTRIMKQRETEQNFFSIYIGKSEMETGKSFEKLFIYNKKSRSVNMSLAKWRVKG